LPQKSQIGTEKSVLFCVVCGNIISVMIQIKQAGLSDAALIAEISRETFYETFAAYNTKSDMDKFLSEQFSKEQLIAEVGKEGYTFLLAYADNTPAGYTLMKESAHADLPGENVIEISRLYARSSFIGKGVGQSLMEAAIAKAKELQKNHIWLGVWEHNHRAIAFYKKFGFEKFSEHDFVLGDDVQRDWVMKLGLGAA